MKYKYEKQVKEILKECRKFLEDTKHKNPYYAINLDFIARLERYIYDILEGKDWEGIESKLNKDDYKLYKKCLEKWDVGPQTQMLIEECSELITATSRIIRGRDKILNNFIEEIADVEIMIEQLKIIYGIEKKVVDMKELKKKRIKRSLK